MDCALEKECNALGGLFQSVINEMKNSYPAWEDVAQKAVKLSVQLRSTIVALNQFLDALQKISDYATNTKGATRDIGTALTRICMRHRSMENRLKTVSSALIDCLVLPLQEHADDWQKRTNNLDKDHAREYKKTKNEIRKRSTDTIRLQKKVRKGENRMQPMLESAVQEMNDRYSTLLDSERRMCRAALIEQRSQFCYFVSWFKPVLDLELGLLEEASHLREVTDLLCKHSAEPNTLPPASEAVICDAKGLEHTWTQQFVSPPSSPSSLGSRKSSFCSLSSGENQSLHYGQRGALNQNSHYRAPQQQAYRGANQQTATTNGRFTSSHDSGIANSQDVIYAPASQHSSGSLERQPLASTPGGLSQQSTPSPSPSAVTWPEHSAIASPVHHDAAIPGLNLSARQSPRHYSQSNGSPNATPRPHTISAADGGGRQPQRQRPPLAAVFVPPQSLPNRPATLGIQRTSATVYKENNGKPPLPGKRHSSATPSLTPTPTMGGGPRMSVPIIPDFNAIQPDQFVPQAIYANLDMADRQRRHRSGSSDAAASGSRRPRPLSFVGDSEDMQRLLQAAGMAFGGGQSAPFRDRSSFASDRGTISNSGSSATMSGRDEDEDTLIEEALGQIDRLTTDLDSYCHFADKAPSTPAYCTLPRQRSADGAIVRWRPALPIGRPFDRAADSRPVTTFSSPYGRGAGVPSAASSMSSVASTGERRSSKAPPPPPLRRNSTITAATPTAPSVEFVRSSRCTTPVEEGGYSSTTMYSLNTRLKMAADRPPDAGVNEHNYQLLQQSNCNSSHYQPARHSQQKSPPHYQMPYMQQHPTSSVVRGASEPPSDQFSVAHETLLLQIRNGVHLRRAAQCNDRSMPHV